MHCPYPNKAAAAALLLLGCASTMATETSPRFDDAMQAYDLGHYSRCAKQLRHIADAGDLRTLEVLGFMHWYGARLYGPGDWDGSFGRELLMRAAAQGSGVAAATLRIAPAHVAAQGFTGHD